MAYLLIEDFRFGLDKRKFSLNSPPGTLEVATNGHITSGGEIEKRKAFTNMYVPPDTFGLEVVEGEFLVFGSKTQANLTAGSQVAITHRSRSSNVATLTFAADPDINVGDIVTVTSVGGTGYNASQVTVTAASSAAPWTISYANTGGNEGSTADTAGRVAPVLPSGVNYQQLVHPDNASAVMTQVIHSTVYNGNAFVIADYGADGIISFYDGVAVDDLSPGRLASVLADADALATYIAAQINALDNGFTASASAGTVTIEGPTGQTFGLTYGPVGTNGAYDSPCETPLDTDPPDVEGVAITAMTFETTAYTCDGTAVSGVYLDFQYNTTGGGANELADGQGLNDFGAGVAGDYNIDGTYSDDANMIAGYGPASVLYGGAGRSISVPVSPSGLPVMNGSFRITVTYAGGATKVIEDSWDVVGGGGVLGPYTLDADPAETTPTITTSVISDGTQPVSGTIPQTQFSVIAVKPAGTGKVTSVTVGATEILGTAVTDLSGANYATPALLAAAIKTQINTYCTANNLDFTATVSNNIVVIRATDPTGYTALTGATVAVTVDDDVCIGNGAVRFSRASVTDPTWTALSIDGADQLGGVVAWNTDMTTSVQDVATQFNTNSTVYTAVASGSTLYVSKLVTSSDDEALQISPAGTNLNWEGANPGGGNTGVNGGTFPGTIDISATDLVLRAGATSGTQTQFTTANVSVTVGGGQPPYLYQWEIVSGGTAIYADATRNYNELPTLSGAIAPTTNATISLVTRRLIGGSGQGSISAGLISYMVGIRCKITDSLNRIGYSPTVNVHYP